MDFRLAIRGDLAKFAEAEKKAGAVAVTRVIRRKTATLKTAVRREIRRAGLGDRLGKAMQENVYPKRGASLSAKGVLKSKALYKRPGGLVDLITVFQEGATITARGGRFLAIPIGAGKREKLANFDDRSVALIPLRSGKGYLVVRRDRSAYRRRSGRGFWGDPLFLLIRQTSIRKRLDFDPVIERVAGDIPQQIVREWERRGGDAGSLG